MRCQVPTPASNPMPVHRAARSANAFARLAALLACAWLLLPLFALAQSPPGTPSSVTVSRADGTLTASGYAVSNATRYHVTYSSDGGKSWAAAADNHAASSITIGNVDNAKTYVVGVRAGNADGWSGWRNSAPAGPLNPPPATPATVTVTRADGTLTASGYAVSNATKYHVTYSADGGQSWAAAANNHTASSITISNVDNGKTYVVGVRAGNAGGWSGWRNSDPAGPYQPPVVPATVTIADASADEGDAMTFTVTLDNAVDGGFTVVPGFTGGTATQGVDYTSTTPGIAFTGTAGETQTFSVATTEDLDVESDETLTVGLRVNGTSHPVTASDTATGTIRDDDTVSLVSASVTIENAKATEGAALSFTVTLDSAVPGGLTVTPTYEDGTASQGSDYTANTAAVAFTGTAGETRTFSVSAHEDGKTEHYEYFTVGLAVSGTAHAVTATDKATGVIYDASASASEGAFAASSSQPPSQIQDKGTYWRLWSPPEPTTKRYEYYCDIPKRIVETTNRAIRSKLLSIPCKLHQGGIPAGAVVEMYSTGSSTATNGSSGNWDYNFYHSKFKMYPGDKGTQRLQFRINDDQSAEGAEYFQFALKWSTKVGYPPVWWTLNESVHTLTVYIDDDDEYDLSVSPAQVWEEAGAKIVTVTAATKSEANLDEARTFSVQVGAGTDTATEGTDYQTVSNFNVTIAKGKSSGSGTFTLTPDRRRPDGGGRADHGDGQRQHSDQRQDVDNPGQRHRHPDDRQRDHQLECESVAGQRGGGRRRR